MVFLRGSGRVRGVVSMWSDSQAPNDSPLPTLYFMTAQDSYLSRRRAGLRGEVMKVKHLWFVCLRLHARTRPSFSVAHQVAQGFPVDPAPCSTGIP